MICFVVLQVLVMPILGVLQTLFVKIGKHDATVALNHTQICSMYVCLLGSFHHYERGIWDKNMDLLNNLSPLTKISSLVLDIQEDLNFCQFLMLGRKEEKSNGE